MLSGISGILRRVTIHILERDLMFVHKTGDVFTTEMPAIGHGVNTSGMMGAGIAKLIAMRHPNVLEPYKKACKDKTLVPGGFQAVLVEEDPSFWILNLASQKLPGRDATLERLESAFITAIDFAKKHELEGFALPRIASDIGGLDWHSQVKPLLESFASAEDSLTVELWSLPNADG